MTKDVLIRSVRDALRVHLRLHDSAGPEDIVKFVFQGLLGVGHLLGDEAEVTARIADEMASLQPDAEEALTESLGSAWCRLNLRRAMVEGLTAGDIARLMLTSAHPAVCSRADVTDACRTISSEEGIPGVLRACEPLADPRWLPSHSGLYRAAYSPAYRVIGADWQPILPVLCRFAALRNRAGRLLVTLDGPCASGKTTLAARLAGVWDAVVLHTDDFVIPHAQKTPERLAIPGGNCDCERLTAEVIGPWAAGQTPTFRRYDCHTDRMLPPETLPDTRVLILEGSYCNLPPIRVHAALRLFMQTPEAERMARLERRESPASLAQFRARWIPLENAYFTHYGLPDADCLIIG